MSKNREILDALAPAKGTDWKVKLNERRKNKAWMSKSMDIVLDILDTLQEKGMTQKDLAKLLGVSPQTVSKTLSGKENISLETIVRYEEVLDISLIHTGLNKTERTTEENKHKEYVFFPVLLNSQPAKEDNGITISQFTGKKDISHLFGDNSRHERNCDVQINLDSINEVSFSIFTNKCDVSNVKDIQLGISNSVAIDTGNNTVKLTFGVIYSQHNDTIMDCVYDFIFSVHYLQSVIGLTSNGSVEIKDIMPDLLSVALGTMRGILVVKTAGTLISRFQIPMIDITQLNGLLGETGTNQPKNQ